MEKFNSDFRIHSTLYFYYILWNLATHENENSIHIKIKFLTHTISQLLHHPNTSTRKINATYTHHMNSPFSIFTPLAGFGLATLVLLSILASGYHRTLYISAINPMARTFDSSKHRSYYMHTRERARASTFAQPHAHTHTSSRARGNALIPCECVNSTHLLARGALKV